MGLGEKFSHPLFANTNKYSRAFIDYMIYIQLLDLLK